MDFGSVHSQMASSIIAVVVFPSYARFSSNEIEFQSRTTRFTEDQLLPRTSSGLIQRRCLRRRHRSLRLPRCRWPDFVSLTTFTQTMTSVTDKGGLIKVLNTNVNLNDQPRCLPFSSSLLGSRPHDVTLVMHWFFYQYFF